LYGHIDAAETYSVGRWLNDVRAALDEAASTSRIPIIVGGTGLYFKALLEGLAAVPPIPSEIRAGIRARLELEGAQALHANLARQDPVSAAKIPPADGVRIARALEVLEATGRPLTDWHATGLAPVLGGAALVMKVFLAPDRAELRRRIDARFDAMLAAGALEEVRALVARRLEALHPPMKAHGVPWLAKVLAGAMPLVEAAEASKTDTRHYTKRQFTWFRRQLADWPWIPPSEAGHAIRRALEGVPA
ncbi:MAG TPA: tRNA (adenosine(37)-N6)-dimethylallyltransferase MiaA, partial [Xanthobacteraceae bacterium]|nr:tRNA (adenosine(37)-N6)-dimethylallyltransferase MiaA [Xanthobacteraceae bacterium]